MATPVDPYAGFGQAMKDGVTSAFGDNTTTLYAAVAIPVAIGVIAGVGLKLLRKGR